MLPRELQALVDDIDACEHEAEQLVEGLDEDEINWAPPIRLAVGQWSVAQCIEHLILMNDFYLRGWPEAVHGARGAAQTRFRGLKPTPIGRWFVRSMEPPVKMKARAIAAVVPPSRVPLSGLIDRYKASHETYRHLARAAAAVDVNRIVAPNAIVKTVKMRLATVLLIVPAHDRRHLWQAANVRRVLKGG